ncbi:hypothetical protein C8A05DRAFT_40294 [Staphylotrichum tortipilum]|uniref:PNPLA domain-containing protein n=1 Tax=Staphylotrichum tortipilum TaxID=2831512 RepID=A0AAN6RYD0_9PEZI|nr:hypothetical protein C8A05DRAFT_40294 [Staphylotrichum longicolle]
MSTTKPKDGEEAVNLLSLDGGGVRGSSSLVILDAIMTRIKDDNRLAEVPKPCDYFHMIAGTNAGGLIAIMLGRLRMSTREALEAYDTCAARIFSSRNKKKWSFSERFCATALQEAVEGIVKERGLGESMRDLENHSKGKVIVCVMPADNIGAPRMVRSFEGDTGVDDDWDEGIMIWEAARATTAASSFFKPQKLGKEETARSYIDAAIGVNNPVDYLLKEAVDEFGSGRRLGSVISIGTGTREMKLGRALTGLKNLVQAPGYYVGLIKTLESTATDGEEIHRHLQKRLEEFSGAYYRFNVPNAAEEVGLHHYKKMPKLKSQTTQYLSGKDVAPQVRQIARALETDRFDHGLTLGHICTESPSWILFAVGNTSPFFTGRKDVMERIDAFFSERNTEGKPRREFLLYGMGGVGKTEIALKASEVLKNRFEYVFFVDGSMPSTISYSYAEICRKNNLGSGNTEALQNFAIRWMEGLRQEWLLIFDDCNMSDRWRHLPGRGRGNVIYTTRSTTLNDSLPADCILEISPLSEADSVDLLLRASNTQSGSLDKADTHLAMKLVKELGCLPLAIETAAAAIRNGISLDKYLSGLRDRKVGILRQLQVRGRNIENPTVHAVLELSHTAILALRRRGGRQYEGRSATLALKLLNLLAFFHYKEFPLPILEKAARERHQRRESGLSSHPLGGILEPPDSDFDGMFTLNPDGVWVPWVPVALSVLESLSLIRWNRKSHCVSMHVLVHRWARHRLDEDIYLRYSLLAKVIFSDSIALTTKWTDKRFSQLLGPDAFLCINRRSKKFHGDNYEAVFQLKIGWVFALGKKFDEAEKLFLQCLSFWKERHEVHAPNVITVLKYLGRLYDDRGRLEDAERMYLEAAEGLKTRGEALNARLAAQEPSTEPTPPTKPTTPTTRPSQVLKITTRELWQLRSLPHKTFRAFLTSRRREDGATGESANAPETAAGQWTEYGDDPEDVLLEFQLVHAELARVFVKQNRWRLGMGRLKQVSQRLSEQLPEDSLERLRVETEAKVLADPGNLDYWNKRLDHWNSLDPKNRDPGEMGHWFNVHMELMSAFADCCLKNRMYRLAYGIYRGLFDEYVQALGCYDSKVLQTLRYMVICKVDGDECEFATVLALEKLYEARFYWSLELDDKTEQILRDAVAGAEACLGANHTITKRVRTRLTQTAATTALGGPSTGAFEQGSQDALTLASRFERHRERLKSLEADLGRHHFMYKRWSRYVGDGPPTTGEEHLERLLACFGPHRSTTKALQRGLETRARDLAEARKQDGKASSSEPKQRGSGSRQMPSPTTQDHGRRSWRREFREMEMAQPSDTDQETLPSTSVTALRPLREWSSLERLEIHSAMTHPHPMRDMPLIASDVCGL